MIAPARPQPKIGEFWKHHKGGIYKIIGIVEHTETKELLVAYKNKLRSRHRTHDWARPLTMFMEQVEFEGKIVNRFERLP